MLNNQLVTKINDLLNQGLTSGLGEPKPGKFCVEAAICYALDLEHSDDPQCVDEALRQYKIVLNDADWSSNIARGKGMKRLAILQLGTKDNFNTKYFTEQLSIRTVNTLLPIVLRYEGFESNAKACEQATTLKQAAFGATHAANAAKYTANAATHAANAAKYTANAFDAAYYASNAAYYASVVIGGDSMLLLSAKIAEDILIEMGVEGTKYLHLLD
jgi:hypothetical protein